MISSRTVAAFLLGAIVVVFAVLNTQSVKVDWIVHTSTAPLIVVIVICGVIGFVIGWLMSRRRERRKRAPAKHAG
jgi:uncharacterized integral membrane protein